MKEKQAIRYLGFECIDCGGRRLDFSVVPVGGDAMEVHIDISGPHFTGSDRILVQEAAGIGYLKIKELCEGGGVRDALRVRLTDIDIGKYRQVIPISGRQKRTIRERTVEQESRG